MLARDERWNMSFAGCGFRSVYYLGALSCVLQRAPRLVHGASRIGGASSGCLVAAALTVGVPVEQLCVDVLDTAKEARSHTLGVFHPTFSLLSKVRDSLLEKLPEDAHVRASGRLCVSLTRLTDGKNVLVSEFDSRDELVQVLVCSCFFPVYCGFVPPSYRGVRYVDGALSNNMPLSEQRNTITVAPFSGESDICPRDDASGLFQTHCSNVSIQVNAGNVRRVYTSFLPPKPQTLAEICHSGYADALRFLRERGLLGAQWAEAAEPACCDLATEARLRPDNREHRWLDPRVIESLPAGIQRVLCEACRDSGDGVAPGSRLTDFLPVKVALSLLTILWLPVQLVLALIRRTADVIRPNTSCASTRRRDRKT